MAGLHAAHEARDELGKALDIVHRDVSPQNLIVGADGVPRVLDFGVAKAATRLQTTREGQLKGKIPYMSPEQLSGEVTAKSDVYSAAIVLWEALTGERLFRGETEAQVLHLVMTREAPPPSTLNPEVSTALDAVVLKGLARDPAARYATARDMAAALEASTQVASAMKIAAWVEALIGPTLAARDAMRAEIESGAHSVNSAAPVASAPAVPAFPRVTDTSSPSVSSLAAPKSGQTGDGIAESTASLVVGAARPPARSRLPWVIAALAAAVAVVAVVAVALRPSVPRASPTTANVAPSDAPAPSEPEVRRAKSVATAPATSAPLLVPMVPAATHPRHHRAAPVVHAVHSSEAPAPSQHEPHESIDTLLDTR